VKTTHSAFTRVAWGLCAYLIAVILFGAWVRITHSGAGCGSHWPTCHGEVIPVAPSTETIIEYTHRLTSGLLGIFGLGVLVWAAARFRRHRVTSAAAVAMFFILMEAMIASVLIAKYAGIVILSDLQGDTLFPLLLERLNIFTDPQRPMVVKEDIYPVNGPGEDSPVLITCNFSLTYFIVSGEIEGSKVPSWLLIKDTEGLSVLTAWAAGKFGADLIAQFINKSGIADKVKHRELIIPGYLATIKGELEEELPDWTITIGPREAGHMPAFLKEWKAAA